MDRVRKLRTFGLWAALAVVILAACFFIALNPFWRRDPFPFLGGRSPFLWGVLPRMEVDSFNAPGESVPPFEYRVYSWRESHSTVVAKADAQLRKLGFKRKGTEPIWVKDDRAVWIDMGPSRNRSEALAGRRKLDQAWVTVIVHQEAPDNLLTALRTMLEPIP